MTIKKLHLWPPFCTARFGSSETPLEAYELAIGENPLDFRVIQPRETLVVDPASGEVVDKYTPERIRFKDEDRVRPVAPFLELFAEMSDGTVRQVNLDLLKAERLDPSAVKWSVDVANLKVFRQTQDAKDKIEAKIGPIDDHQVHELQGVAENFLPGKYISFGTFRYIKPNERAGEIRARFTPGKGLVYGSSTERIVVGDTRPTLDPVFQGFEDRIVYDRTRGKWHNFQADASSPTLPNPSDIYQGRWPDTEPLPIGWGYLDDVCDGRVTVSIALASGEVLTTSAWIGTCMPAYAPDSQPMRTVADELEQLIMGTEVPDSEVSVEDAAEIVRRALESIRLMNTAAMNANVINGRTNIASTLYRQDTNDYGRDYAPGMASSLVDPSAVRTLHERIYTALKSGSAPWFAEVLRKPEEIGDLSDKARRKMPPMLRGADGRALTLTRRQINRVVRAATAGLFESQQSVASSSNRTAFKSVGYRAAGNPVSTLPSSAISNCFPGLEYDFKNFWRRVFVGIVLLEWDNYVVEIEDPKLANLRGHRLLRVNGVPVVTSLSGPVMPGGGVQPLPYGKGQVVTMEWSNALAFIRKHQGQKVECDFTSKPAPQPTDVPKGKAGLLRVSLIVRPIFERDSLSVSDDYLRPGELTQGLCSPWQHDYRECSCYYWPASRPDFVNATTDNTGTTRGDNWLSKQRNTGQYVLDDRKDTRLLSYDDLFMDWERQLQFQIRGRDAEKS